MNILFLGYWGAKEGLSVATIYPHLEILATFEHITKIYYFSMERDSHEVSISFESSKIEHTPFYSSHNLQSKYSDFTDYPKRLIAFVKANNIKRIICRGAPTGIIGYKVSKKTGVPYYVESYEPHAAYMLEAGVWNWFDPRYLFEKYWEEKQKKTASYLMPVSYKYALQLQQEGVEKEKVLTIPCCVSMGSFAFDMVSRQKIRDRLGITSDVKVGVYVGKFGGMYYAEKAFELFKNYFEFYNNQAYLIILTPQSEYVNTKLLEYKIPLAKTFTGLVDHKEVADYLSASDVAFSLHQSTPSKVGISPIKNGEYWANGLPIILPDGIGDDSDIIRKYNIGSVLGENYYQNIKEIDSLLKESTRKELYLKIRKVAEKYRSFDIAERVYREVYSI